MAYVLSPSPADSDVEHFCISDSEASQGVPFCLSDSESSLPAAADVLVPFVPQEVPTIPLDLVGPNALIRFI